MNVNDFSRRDVLTGLGVTAFLTAACGLEKLPSARVIEFQPVAEPSRNHEYLAVFGRTDRKQPFAVIQRPKDVKIGKGTNVEVEAFTLAVEEIDDDRARGFLQKLTELDRETSQQLPDGFRVYCDKRFAEISSSYSKRYKITFTDPVDAITKGGERSGPVGGNVGGTGGGPK